MICTFCNIEFTPNSKGSGGTNRKFCFSCIPEGLSRKERNTFRRELLTLKARKGKVELGCSNCGYNKNPSALEWHHPSEGKDKDPADSLAKSWDSYLEEINECVLLCANCHREEHFKWK